MRPRETLAVALSVITALVLRLDAPWWAAISAFVSIPITAPSSIERGALRIIGAAIGAAIAVLLSPWLIEEVPWLVALCAGVWIGAHIQSSARGIGYVGTQGAVVFMMTLVQGFGPPASILAGIERFASITGGLLIVLAVSVLPASGQHRSDMA